MEAKQKNVGFNFKALSEILFGASLKSINEQKQQDEELQKELEEIYKEEKRSGATKRIEELSDKLSKHEEVKEKKQKIFKVEAKASVKEVKQNAENINETEREIGE